MARRALHPPVARINLAVVKQAFRTPAASDTGYYIFEKGNTLVCLRVRRTVVQVGVRHRAVWHQIANLSTEMSIQEVENLRTEAARLAREVQGEDGLPGLARGRSMTIAQLHNEYMADLREARGDVMSPRTFASYDDLWRLYLLPTVGAIRLPRLTVDLARQLIRDIPAMVLARRPQAKAGGRYMANAALQQLSAALEFACRMEWSTRNVASARLVRRYETSPREHFLDGAGYAAVGQVLRDFEAGLACGKTTPLSLRTLLALRVAIYTGVRHRSELLWTRLDWCHLEGPVPRIGIPRAKGDRGGKRRGRWIFLGPESIRCLKAIVRPTGSEHLTIPGDKPGRPLFRLNEAWAVVLRTAGLPAMPVHTLRHGFSTHSVGIIAPEHRAQLLGHQGRPMTDTVYLHRHGPDLARAAALVEEHLRMLLGDLHRTRNATAWA
jgi:integrase